MTYATQQNLTDRYGKEFADVAEDSENEGQIDTVRVARVLTDAAAEVDSYIGKMVDLPLIEPYDPILEKVTGDIAMYNMPVNHFARTEHQRERYEDAIKLLTKIGNGTGATLRVTETAGDIETSDPEEAEITSSTRLFVRSSMGNIT